jgi:hypothetical protein
MEQSMDGSRVQHPSNTLGVSSTRWNAMTSSQKRKRQQEQEDGDTKTPSIGSLKKAKTISRGFTVETPILSTHSYDRGNLAKGHKKDTNTYHGAFYGTQDDSDWSTLRVSRKQPNNRGKSKNVHTTGVFKLPIGATSSSRSIGPYSDNIPPRRTLLTIYQPPPPLQMEKENKTHPYVQQTIGKARLTTELRDQEDYGNSLDTWNSSEDYEYGLASSDNYGSENIESGSSSIGYENIVPDRHFPSYHNRANAYKYHGPMRNHRLDFKVRAITFALVL